MPRTPRRDPGYHERRLQIFLVRRFRRYVMPWHAQLALIGNGEYRPPATTSLLHALGLVDGLHDLILILPAGRVRWIEVKLERTEEHARTDLSQVQIEVHDELRWLDHACDTVRNFDELWAIVEEEAIPHRLVAVPRTEQARLDLIRRRRNAGLRNCASSQ